MGFSATVVVVDRLKYSKIATTNQKLSTVACNLRTSPMTFENREQPSMG